MPPPPAWAIAKVRELVAEGDTPEFIAEHLHDLGLTCTPRQVRRWKEVHGIKRQWAGGDAALDGIVQQLVASDELGDEEGYRWVHSIVNEHIPGHERVGCERVRRSLKRVMPAQVDARKAIVEKTLQRRVYVADYYGERTHIDLECKLIFGSVRLYIYGHVRSATATRRAPRPAAVRPGSPRTALPTPPRPTATRVTSSGSRRSSSRRRAPCSTTATSRRSRLTAWWPPSSTRLTG